MEFETFLEEKLSGLLFVGGVLVSESNLVKAGTIAIVLDDETIHDVPSQDVRRRSDEFGQETIRAFLMSPVDFDKVRTVIRRREEKVAAAA